MRLDAVFSNNKATVTVSSLFYFYTYASKTLSILTSATLHYLIYIGRAFQPPYAQYQGQAHCSFCRCHYHDEEGSYLPLCPRIVLAKGHQVHVGSVEHELYARHGQQSILSAQDQKQP